MEIFVPHTPSGLPEAVVLDFDGTLSKLRAGWEGVMTPMMCELIPGEPDEVRQAVVCYIDESTGIQTIHQMRWLASEIQRRGGKPEDPWEYKDEYNRRLMREVVRRRKAVLAGEESREKYTVPGGMDFIRVLFERGVKLYAASGTDEEDVQAEAAVLGFTPYFREIAGAGRGTDACSKEAVLRRLIQNSRRLLVIGDGKVEIALGREVNALTLGVASLDDPGDNRNLCNAQKYNRLKAAGAHGIIPNFNEKETVLAWI